MSKQKLMWSGKMTSTCVLFSPVAIIVASKYYSKYYLLTVKYCNEVSFD